MLKIVCCCDIAIPPTLMAGLKKLEEKYDVKVELFEDDWMQVSENITEVMLKVEQEGAEASPANPAFIEAAKDADILVVHASPVNSALINQAPNLKYIMVLRSGIENVNEELCKEKGITVINAPGRSAPAVADMTVGMILAENKNIARGHKAMMDGEWRKIYTNTFYIHDLARCTVGIIGIGYIGRQVEKRLKAFGCKILVHDPFMAKEEVEALGYTAATKEEILKQSDFVTLHLRLSEKTHHFIKKEDLEMMKPEAFFINAARAGLVDEEALIEILQEKKIGGAALDVFEKEPLGKDHPILKLDNITITPHLAGTSMDTFANSVDIIYERLDKVLEGLQ